MTDPRTCGLAALARAVLIGAAATVVALLILP